MKTSTRVADLGLDLEVRRLSLLLKNTTGGCLAFALYRDVAQRAAVVRYLQRRLSLPLYELTLSPDRRDPVGLLRDLLPEVERTCQATARSPRASRRALISIYDVERAFPEALGYLNLQREFLAQVPHAVVFWVLEYGLREIAGGAPDLWDWRSEVFDFRGPEDRTLLLGRELALTEGFFYRDRGDLERRLSLYLGLLQDQAGREKPDEAFIAVLEGEGGPGLLLPGPVAAGCGAPGAGPGDRPAAE